MAISPKAHYARRSQAHQNQVYIFIIQFSFATTAQLMIMPIYVKNVLRKASMIAIDLVFSPTTMAGDNYTADVEIYNS